MGRPHLSPDEVPVLAESSGPVLHLPVRVEGGDFDVTCVSMGNPHAVVFCPDVSRVPLESDGPAIENAAATVVSSLMMR